ncbi:hypothetical protein OSTOST_11934, partial [Ostertagia ostertagi]
MSKLLRARETAGSEVNTNLAVSLNQQWIRRRLDSSLLPTDGHQALALVGLGYARGGGTDSSGPFGRMQFKLGAYRPIGGWYASARAEVAQVVAAERVGVPEKLLFLAGGDESVRGYAYRSLGPVQNGLTVGGRVMATGSLEIARPFTMSLPSLWGAAFIDAGNAASRWTDYRPVVAWASPYEARRSHALHQPRNPPSEAVGANPAGQPDRPARAGPADGRLHRLAAGTPVRRRLADGAPARRADRGPGRLAHRRVPRPAPADHLAWRHRRAAGGTASLDLDTKGLKLDGKLAADEGLFDFTRSDAPALADDVTVLRGTRDAEPTAPPAPKAARNTSVNLAVDFGRDFKVRGRGLATTLRGQLQVTQNNGPLRVNGKLTAGGGQYAAYGQKLDIERGDITFTGALDNPSLDLLAGAPQPGHPRRRA